MNLYQIQNSISGVNLGTHSGVSINDALLSLYSQVGYDTRDRDSELFGHHELIVTQLE